jgi:multidrug efflux pump subunit AcrA (membrane-fusion protein)
VDAPEQVGANTSLGTPLFLLARLDVLILRTSIPEDARSSLRVGAKLHVESVTGGASTHDARVVRVLPSADPATRRIPVEIEVPNPDNRFLANTLARAWFPLGEEMDAEVVPATALATRGGDHVFVLDPSGNPRKVPVAVLSRTEDEVVVRSSSPLSRVVAHPSVELLEN